MMSVHVSPKYKIVGVPVTPAVINMFPQADRHTFEGNDIVLVPHKPAESFMLRRLGFDVPSPILSHYDWPHPIGQPPFEAQRKTCALLTMNNRAYVLNGMGTGKTRAALWSWDYLNKAGLTGKLIVVAPLSTLKFTWAREVFSVLPGRKYSVLHGTREKRIAMLNDPECDIFIINHDGMKIVKGHIDYKVITSLVIDELAVYRNGGAQRTKDMKKIASNMQWVWGMTGSPVPNDPTDAWAQATIVTPNTVPKYFGRYRDELMTKVSQFKYVPKSDAVHRAFASLQPAVRFTLDDVMELPETVYQTMDIELGPKQAKVYKDLAATCYAAVQAQEITAANAGAVMSKLLQVSTGYVYTGDHEVVPLDNDERIKAMIDMVNASDQKVLVFAPFKHALAGISAALTSEGIEHATVSGDTSANERAQIFNLFQNTGKYRVIAAHPQCLAHGITLTAATTIIWFAPVTSLEIYEQANARISRVGQKHKQLVVHLQSTPVEKKIYQLLRSKQKVQNKLLDLFAVSTQQEDFV